LCRRLIDGVGLTMMFPKRKIGTAVRPHTVVDVQVVAIMVSIRPSRRQDADVIVAGMRFEHNDVTVEHAVKRATVAEVGTRFITLL